MTPKAPLVDFDLAETAAEARERLPVGTALAVIVAANLLLWLLIGAAVRAVI